ncbi:fork head domain-containing protein [Aphelenchoides avenae]|nr:fork head domain-containing protein [Aphelenchus avenae]
MTSMGLSHTPAACQSNFHAGYPAEACDVKPMGTASKDVVPKDPIPKKEKRHRRRAECSLEKPPHSYITLIGQAILAQSNHRATLNQIYKYLGEKYDFFRNEQYTGWKNSIRHNLSLNPCFIKLPKTEGSKQGKGHEWTVDGNYDFSLQNGQRRRQKAPKVKAQRDAGHTIEYAENPMAMNHPFDPVHANAAMGMDQQMMPMTYYQQPQFLDGQLQTVHVNPGYYCGPPSLSMWPPLQPAPEALVDASLPLSWTGNHPSYMLPSAQQMPEPFSNMEATYAQPTMMTLAQSCFTPLIQHSSPTFYNDIIVTTSDDLNTPTAVVNNYIVANESSDTDSSASECRSSGSESLPEVHNAQHNIGFFPFTISPLDNHFCS